MGVGAARRPGAPSGPVTPRTLGCSTDGGGQGRAPEDLPPGGPWDSLQSPTNELRQHARNVASQGSVERLGTWGLSGGWPHSTLCLPRTTRQTPRGKQGST